MSNWRKSSHSFANGNCAEVAAWRKSTASVADGHCAEVGSWRKSPASADSGACAEVGAWRTSSHSTSNADCAEVGQDGAVVGVRDSMDPGGPVLAFTPAAWAAFLAGLRSG